MTVVAGTMRTRLATRLAARVRSWVPPPRRTTATARVLVAVVIALNVIGAAMVLSASSVLSLDGTGSAWYFFRRQAFWSALGAVAFVAASRVDYHRWRDWSLRLLGLAFVLLTLVLVPGIGRMVGDSRRWLGTEAVGFQPSELAKLALLCYAATVGATHWRRAGDPRALLRPVALVTAGLGALVMAEPDLDTTLVLGIIAGSVLLVSGARARHLVALGGAAAAAVIGFLWLVPFRRARLLTFLSPWSDPTDAGYQITQSLKAIGSGGILGVGVGAGRAKWGFLPAAHTDFIFAVIAEELGLIGSLAVVGLFATLAVLGVRAAGRAPDRLGMLLAAGTTGWLTGQAVINLGMVVGVLPVSGLPLPFVSFGGSALVVSMVAAGILTNVAVQGRR